jgi:molybdopterin molybdotransferase
MTTLPDYTEALSAALAAVEPLRDVEECGLDASAGRVLAQPIVADRPLPPFDRAQMDGYALRAAELATIKAFPVAATIAAGRRPDVTVPPGACVKIATGAALPPGLDAVIPQESSDRGDPVRFRIGSVEPGHAVHRRGADARAGNVLVGTPAILAARHLGLAAAVGLTRLTVIRRPRAVLLTSGDEVVPPAAPVEPHQIRNSNAPMVAALLRAIGAEPVGAEHVPDDETATARAVAAAIPRCHLLVTVGGISVGERDRFPDALASAGVTMVLRGAAIQPGRPTQVGRAAGGAVVLALPGNPVSALACACLFAWPIVRRLLALDADLPWRRVELAERVVPNAARRAFRPAVILPDGRARIPPWAGSGDLAHTAPTGGLLELPVQSRPVEAGTALRFLPWPDDSR